jgi:hypothetical protein
MPEAGSVLRFLTVPSCYDQVFSKEMAALQFGRVPDVRDKRWSDVFFDQSPEVLEEISSKMQKRIPGFLPVIIDRSINSNIELSQHKMRVSKTDPIGVLMSAVRKHWKTDNPQQALLFFVYDSDGIPTTPCPSHLANDVYKQNNRHGFLYMTVQEESVFG